jgi:MFS family permease
MIDSGHSSLMKPNKPILLLLYPLFIWLIAAVFYCHQYILRVSISPVANALMHGFKIDAVTLSFVAASFFYAYIIVQIFAGLIVERYGLKLSIIISTSLCGVGSLLMAEATAVSTLFLGRILIGAGAAFALLLAVVIIRLHFSKKIFPILNGLTISLGTVGGFLGGAPLAFYLTETSWRHVMWVAAIISFVLLLFGVLFIRRGKRVPNAQADQRAHKGWSETFHLFAQVIRTKQVWLAGVFSGFICLPLVVFSGLWGTPFLHAEYQDSSVFIRLGLSMIFIGYGIGAPLLGWLSDIFPLRRVMRLFALLGFCASLALIYWRPESIYLLFAVIFVLGFCIGAAILSMSYVKQHVSLEASPIAFSLVIMMISLSGAVALPVVGDILQAQAGGHWLHGVELFSVSDYHWALALIPAAFFVSFILSLFLVKTE